MILKSEIKFLFQNEIDEEVYKNEIVRSKISVGFGLFLACLFFILPTFFEAQYIKIFSDRFSKYTLFYFFLAIEFFFLLIYILILRSKKESNSIPIIPRYINAFFEASIPSILIIILGFLRPDYPLYNLAAPPAFAYFIFIILSALRMNVKLSIFTGSVAGLEYLGLSIFFLNRNIAALPVDYIVSINGLVLRSLFIIFSGFIIAYVTSQIEKRLLHSFDLINQRNNITSIFGQHVSPAVVEKLINQSDFESELKHVSIMFFDIRNFTAFSEKRKASDVVAYLNQVFDFSIEIINRHNGIINKFLGDGFMAVFGAPISDGAEIKNSVNAALEILAKIKSEVETGILLPTKAGIGLHSGEAVTGNIGSSTRKEYTIIGDVVNLASRVEQLNKTYNAELLITEDINKHLDETYLSSYIGEVLVKGRETPVKIFQLK